MNEQILRKSLATLLREVYEGPTDANAPTWIVSNGTETGFFGTLKRLNADQASVKSFGVGHSIAEHVAHLKFSLNLNLRYAKGDFPKANWQESWHIPQPLTSAGWRELQQSLRDSYTALFEWLEKNEQFEEFESICGFAGSVAHASYHLGAVRQLAKIAGR